MKLKSWLLIVIVLSCMPAMLNAQVNDGIQYPQEGRAAQYYLGTGNELVVAVNIWGFVQRPGQYMVPNNTDLISLLSFAGGPREGAKISNIRIVRANAQTGTKVWKVNVRKYIETGDEKIIPVLKPGDTIIVKGTAFSWIQKLFTFLSSFAVFAQMFYFIVLASDRLNN
jgi:protein involved in polysaccharide export with SLBB domain